MQRPMQRPIERSSETHGGQKRRKLTHPNLPIPDSRPVHIRPEIPVIIQWKTYSRKQ